MRFHINALFFKCLLGRNPCLAPLWLFQETTRANRESPAKPAQGCQLPWNDAAKSINKIFLLDAMCVKSLMMRWSDSFSILMNADDIGGKKKAKDVVENIPRTRYLIFIWMWSQNKTLTKSYSYYVMPQQQMKLNHRPPFLLNEKTPPESSKLSYNENKLRKNVSDLNSGS